MNGTAGGLPRTTCTGRTVTCTCGDVCPYATPAEAAEARWRHALAKHAPWNGRPSRRERPLVPTPVTRPHPVLT